MMILKKKNLILIIGMMIGIMKETIKKPENIEENLIENPKTMIIMMMKIM